MMECIISAAIIFFNQIRDLPTLKVFFIETMVMGLLKISESSDTYIEALAPLIYPAINAIDLKNKYVIFFVLHIL